MCHQSERAHKNGQIEMYLLTRVQHWKHAIHDELPVAIRINYPIGVSQNEVNSLPKVKYTR